MSPEIPDHCPLGAAGSGCRLQKHSKRMRKAGPGFALVVLNCLLHCRYYTLYPLGFAPYRRARIAPVGEDGQVSSRTATGLEGWEGTLFEAVLCLEMASSPNLGLEPGTRQRRRQLEVAATVLGLTGSASAAERAAVDQGSDLLCLTTAKAAYALARGVQQRALALQPVLAALPRSGPLLLRLLRAGTSASVWGGAWWWTGGSGYVRSFQSWERG